MNENIGVYAEAKGEYTRQLCQFLVPALQDYFLEMLNEAKEKDTDSKKLLWNFQNLLKDIPEWNIDRVKRETTKLLGMTKCDYLEELLTAVFIAHTKVLSAIRLTTKQKKLQITIPKLDHFLHRTLGDCARVLWSNVYYFTPTGSGVERQKNLNAVEGLLNDGVLQSIRSMLPVKSILREYLHDDQEEEEEEGTAPPAVVAPAEAAPEVAAEAAPEPVTVPVAEPVAEPVTVPVPVAEPAATPAIIQQTIIVDTEPVVRFTNKDTIFSDDPEKNTIQEVNMITATDEQEDEDELKFLDEEGTAMDDFEEL